MVVRITYTGISFIQEILASGSQGPRQESHGGFITYNQIEANKNIHVWNIPNSLIFWVQHPHCDNKKLYCQMCISEINTAIHTKYKAL